MALIEVKEVNKEFKVYKRQKGILNNLKSLIVRDYEIKNAVENISFSINQGELVGYIGANGAGKSTTIKMLSGILVPTNGQVIVDGIEPYKNRKENAMKIGVVFGQRSQLNWDLPMEDTFELYKRMYKISDTVYSRNVEMFVELMQMQDFIRKPVRQLSLGQKMRAEIAIALLHDPKILYLDEPTIGLDVLVKDKIRTFIRELNKEKKTTVILTTHDMKDIDQICDRVIMIDKGKLIIDSTLNEFKEINAENYNVLITYDQIKNEISIPGVICKEQVDNNQRLYSIDRKVMSVNDILTCFSDAFHLTDISIKRAEIDEIVSKIYQRQ
jgi:ABC-2 type transport system ATP-binding protein